MILKIDDERQIELAIKTRTAKKFEDKYCNENENLISKLPQLATGNKSIEGMVEIISFFQVGKKKLPTVSEDEYDEDGNLVKEGKYDIYDFLDDYLVANETSITELYRKVIEEFDIRGIIERGMGFQISNMIVGMMDEMKKQFTVENFLNNI